MKQQYQKENSFYILQYQPAGSGSKVQIVSFLASPERL